MVFKKLLAKMNLFDKYRRKHTEPSREKVLAEYVHHLLSWDSSIRPRIISLVQQAQYTGNELLEDFQAKRINENQFEKGKKRIKELMDLAADHARTGITNYLRIYKNVPENELDNHRENIEKAALFTVMRVFLDNSEHYELFREYFTESTGIPDDFMPFVAHNFREKTHDKVVEQFFRKPIDYEDFIRKMQAEIDRKKKEIIEKRPKLLE